MEEARKRIGNTQGTFMLGVAVVIDLVQGLFTASIIGIIVSVFISIFAWLMFYFWFKLNGVGFIDGSIRFVAKTMILWGGAFIEMIPVINVLPVWTLSVALMLFIIRAEDTIYNKTGKSIEIQKALRKTT